MSYRGMTAEIVTITGDKGDKIEAYYAKPTGKGPFPGVVLIHHMPGWDDWTMEAVRKLAHQGFGCIAHHLYHRFGPGTPDDLAAKARSAGGVYDDEVVADVKGAMEFLRAQPESNGKVGMMGFCSGGRHTYLAACRLDGVDAAVDCWGGNVVVDDPTQLTPQRPVAPIDLTPNLKAPMLGLFGNEDKNPSPAQVDTLEAKLKECGKTYDFHRYDGAGHAFFAAERPAYRVEQANDGWQKIYTFYHKHLG